MPEVLGEPPSPRTALFWNGTAWQWALVDAAGHLQIDVQTILGLEGALQSVGTDRLIVRGEDQLFSFLGTLANARTADISGADGFVDSTPVAAGEVWAITHVVPSDNTSPTTAHRADVDHDGGAFRVSRQVTAFAAAIASYHTIAVFLDPSDFIRVYFTGGLVGDKCTVRLHGYRMTLEV
ncbi:hypothetical protein ES703_20334 [subsurface metagenome]